MSTLKLLSVGNTKTIRGEGRGYRTYILHLAPHKLSGYNVCPMASAGCAAACLYWSGRGRFAKTQEARLRKTKWFMESRDQFMAQLFKDIVAAERDAIRHDLIPVFRLNGTSDIRWETLAKTRDVMQDGLTILQHFSHLQFYDYTKLPNRRDVPANYHLTFSRSESNEGVAWQQPYNVAVVFHHTLPAVYRGRPVIDGTRDDLRFLDPAGVVVGLLAKGSLGKHDTSGFVIHPEDI